MSLEALFDHKCDIYHIRKEGKSPGYGLAASPSFNYLDEPDIKEQACHFGVKSAAVTVTQAVPANLMDAKIKLTIPIGTDVRINDKIVNCDTGLEYTAEQPINVRDHHVFVYLKRVEGQKAL